LKVDFLVRARDNDRSASIRHAIPHFRRTPPFLVAVIY